MMATFDEARAALSALLSQYENRRLYKRGSLGNGDGATFAVVGPAGYTTNWNHFEADPSNGRHYYAYTETGPDMRLHRSTDAGATWTALTLPGMLIQSGTGGHYPGSSIYFYSGLRVSVDGGVTWEDRTGNFWAIQQGGAQEHRRTIPLTPARTWGG